MYMASYMENIYIQNIQGVSIKCPVKFEVGNFLTYSVTKISSKYEL